MANHQAKIPDPSKLPLVCWVGICKDGGSYRVVTAETHGFPPETECLYTEDDLGMAEVRAAEICENGGLREAT